MVCLGAYLEVNAAFCKIRNTFYIKDYPSDNGLLGRVLIICRELEVIGRNSYLLALKNL